MRAKLKKLHGWCNAREWAIFLVLLVVVLRLPSLFTPHYYGDEEIYFVMGRAWRVGVPMYQAMFDHKPPLIYILAGIAQNVFWFRTILLVWMTAQTLVFWKLAQKFWVGTRPKLAYLSSLIFVLLSTLPTFEGNIVNAELLMMLPMTVSLLMIWPTSKKTKDGKSALTKKYSWQRYTVAGLVAGIGWLFKVPVVMDFLAIAIFFFPFQEKTLWKSIKAVMSLRFIVYAVGFALPFAMTFVYYYLKGNGPAYLDTVLTMNLGYVSSWSTSTYAFNPFKSGIFVRAMVVAGVTLGLYISRKKLHPMLTLGALWLAFSFFGAMLSGRPYPHYLQEPFVPLALVFPFVLVSEKVLEWLVIIVLVVWIAITNIQVKFWLYPSWPLYKDFFMATTGKMTTEEYNNSFDGARRNYAIGKYLNERMGEEDQLYLWGSDATIYNITNKLPSGGKYIVNFHVRDLKKFEYVMEELSKSKPKFIVVLPDPIEFPALFDLISRDYVKAHEDEGTVVYLRF
ncbi:MAG: hypothetical protein ABII80_02590 [bacterium]